MKKAICCVTVPSGLPGKVRFKLPSSIGEVRVPAIAAGKFAIGNRITRPLIIAGSSDFARLLSATCPSYSSPWLPETNSAVGPSPFLITTIGIGMNP